MGFFYAVKFLKYLSILSIDVALASLSVTFMIASLHQISMTWSVYLALTSSVWLIYTFDHLMDAKSITKRALTDRHRFHQDFFKPITYIWLSVLIFSAFLILPFLPHRTILFGVSGASLVIAHFVLVKFLGTKVSIWVQKEFGVALVFTLGVFIGPLSYISEWDSTIGVQFFRLFLVAFYNLIMFSFFDFEVDNSQDQTSLVRVVGKQNTKLVLLLINLLFVISFTLKAYDSSFYFYSFVLIIYNMMVFTNLRYKLSKGYRYLGDSVLALAGLCVFL